MLVNLNDILIKAKKNKYAVGLFNTVINLILLVSANYISNKVNDEGLF